MKVWRVQNVAGIGPYHANVLPQPDTFPGFWDADQQTMLCVDHEDSDHPTWFRDGITIPGDFLMPSEYLSGFATLDALIEWFDGWLTTLVTSGFDVVQCETDTIIYGEYQLAFVPKGSAT